MFFFPPLSVRRIDSNLMVQSHPREENEVVPPILEAVLKQPDEVHMQVAFTSVQLLAELNEWIACHPDVLPLVLQFLTKRLHNKHLATVAAKVCIHFCLIKLASRFFVCLRERKKRVLLPY